MQEGQDQGKSVFYPVGSWIAVEQVDEDRVSEGGIILPTESRDAVRHGRVVRVGDAVKRPMDVGSVVVFSVFGAVDLSVFGRKLVLVREEDLLGVLRSEA